MTKNSRRSFRPLSVLAATVAIIVAAPCNGHDLSHGTSASTSATLDANAHILNHLADAHGVAGPWALLGYRAGQVAMNMLEAKPHTRALQIVHRAPAVPQYSCMLDGVAVVTGNSVGQLNLRLESVESTKSLETIAWLKDDTETSAVLVRPRPETIARYANLPGGPPAMEWANMDIQSKTNDALFEVEWIDRPDSDKP